MVTDELLQKLVVHIVDDDVSVRNGLSRLLQAADLDTQIYESTEEFLSRVRNERNACLLLDITMPRITGLEVQEILNARQITLPVIAVSASDDREARQRALDLGAEFFFRKPVDDQALLDAIAWVTNPKHRKRDGQ